MLEQGHGAVQPFNGRTEVFARSSRQLSHHCDFPQQLQGIAHVLDRTLGAQRPGRPAATVERAAALGSTPPVDHLPALLRDARDQLTPRFIAPVAAAAAIGKQSGAHGLRAGVAGRVVAGIGPQKGASVARTSRET